LLCTDLIRGVERNEPTNEEDHYLQIANPRKERLIVSGAHRVVVTSEHGNVIVGVDAEDRPGLLLDISKGLLGLNLTLRHSEAAVVSERSISTWRCELIGNGLPDHEEI
jgi:UTP:GlnB (protein PII) uridylyltransferase